MSAKKTTPVAAKKTAAKTKVIAKKTVAKKTIKSPKPAKTKEDKTTVAKKKIATKTPTVKKTTPKTKPKKAVAKPAKKEKASKKKGKSNDYDDDEEDVVVKDDYYATDDDGDEEEPVIPKKKAKKGKKGEEVTDDVETEAFEVIDDIVDVAIDDDEIEVKIKRGSKKVAKKTVRKIKDEHFEFDVAPAIAPDSKYIMFEMEFPIHSSLGVLYEFLIEPTALQEWFADRVQERNSVYTFFWQNAQQQAQLLKEKVETLIRFRWLDGPRDTFFEFRIIEDELTRDTTLVVIDYAEDADEIVAAKQLWTSQIDDLHRVLGAR